jgi:hypothetical protein
VGLTRRHFAVSLVEKDGHLKCPGGGVEHPLTTMCACSTKARRGPVHTCKKIVFLLHQKYGVVNIWEIEPHEALMTMEREHMTDPRKILEYLNRGAKRLDRT